MEHRGGSWPLRAAAQDVALALLVTVMQVQGTLARFADDAGASRPLGDHGNLGYALLVVSGLVLAGRRRWPVPVFVAVSVASMVYTGLDFPDGPSWLGVLVALYTLTAYGDGRRSLLVAGAGTAVLTVWWLVAAADVEPREAIGWVFFRIGLSVVGATLGESVRSRRVIAAEAQERAELAERTREEEARARVAAERLRIAREVHDTVAHAIAIINVQAGVTAHVLDKRPEQARAALQAIEQTSSRALREMRAVLGVLRDGDDARAPQPGLDQIDELTAKARDAGLDITLDATLPATPLPSAVGSAAYRILQESITNVIRHAGPTRVTVALHPGVDVLEIRVTDEGRRRQRSGNGTGNGTGNGSGNASGNASGNGTGTSAEAGRGIQGMRERCHLLGGELDARPTPGGGFEVTARLPLAPAGSRL